MRSIQIFLALVFLFSFSGASALVYPTGTPDATEVYGGTYYNYFTNIFSSETSCNATGKVVGGFRSDGTPICVLPGISPGFVIPGSLTGDTLRYDGTDWVRNNLLYNNGTAIGIGNQNPQAKLDVSGDVLVNGLTVGRGGGNDLMNTVLGSSALLHNINGTENSAQGAGALQNNISGSQNVANGWSALWANTSGDANVANGYASMNSNTIGSYNTANGWGALKNNSTGNFNTSIGYSAGSNITTGSNNIVIGSNSIVPSPTSSNQLNIGNWIYGSGGNIGIGVSSPLTSAKLEVNGQIKITGGGSGSGKVLTSDASGLATWQTPTAASVTSTGVVGGTENYVAKFGTGGVGLYISQIFDNGSSIGIGTSLPGAKLDVNGDILVNGLTVGQGKINASNTAFGQSALGANTLGNRNVAIGYQSIADISGNENTAVGYQSLWKNTSSANTAVGNSALRLNTSGTFNTAHGHSSLSLNINGNSNSAFGQGSLGANIGGSYNSAFGVSSLYANISGDRNVAIGISTLANNISGGYNSAFGNGAGSNLGSGDYNIFIGANTQPNISNTASNQLNIGNWIYGNNGNIGIGVSSPLTSAKLEVNGQIKITGGSPGTGMILTSIDANGLASWQVPNIASVTATGIVGGIQNYISKFGTGGNGLYSSQIFDNGVNIGIGTSMPTTKFEVAGSGLIQGDLTVQGNLIVDRLINRTVNNISISGSLLPDAGAPLFYRDIGSLGQKWNNLYLSGQISISGGSPGSGKVLMSDASGLASWQVNTSASATGITGGIQNYVAKFGTGGVGIYSSQLFDDGSNMAIGNNTPTSKFEVWSGAVSLLHFRGANNTALGSSAVKYTLTGNANTGIGSESLFTLTTGYSNSAFGYRSLRQNTTGFNNTAIGQEALYNNNGGSWNSAVGYQALYSNVSGINNIAEGPQALFNLSTGNNNIAIGYQSLRVVAGSSVSSNVAIGYQSLYSTTSSNQVAIGYQSLYSNTSGISNTAIGYQSLDANTTGSNNTAIGDMALGNTTGSNNTALGSSAGSGITTGSNNILIGHATQVPLSTASNQLNIGNWIYGSGGNIGIGVSIPSTKLELNSGISNISGLKFTQMNSSSPLYVSGSTNPLGVDGSGNVVPVQGGMIPVYTALGASPNSPINTSINPPTIGADYDKYFNISARQSFAVTDVGGNPYNCPEMTIGSTNKGPTGCTATPWSTYVMTAQAATTGDRYGYQIMISDRTDAPFIVRGGMYSSSNNTLMNTAKTIPSLWFKALTVPTNHSDWLYVNPGVDQNNNPISGGGNVGIGTMTPAAILDVDGTFKLGTNGTVSTAAGTCTIASTAISTIATSYTCTGVPASTSVAVNCSASAGFSSPNTTSLYCRANGTANQVTCNTTVANSNSMTYKCMWMQ